MLDESEEQGLPPNFLFALKKYKWWMLASIIVLACVSAAIVFSIAPSYRSEGLVLVETQDIPEDLVQSTVTSLAEERIKFIEQRVMTRGKLLAIAERYPEITDGDYGSTSELIGDLRNSITIEHITDGRKRGATTVAFTVAFEHKSPQISQAVAEDLVNLFLDENIKTRITRAAETTDFITQESQRLKNTLDETERAISEYKQENRDALPEHLDLYMSMLARAETKSTELKRKLELTQSQKSLIEAQIELDAKRGQAPKLESTYIDELKAEYQKLSIKYKEAHPDLISLKIAIKEAESSERRNPQEQTMGLSGQKSKLESSIDSLVAESQLVADELERNELDIADLEAKIIKIPQIEQGLIGLKRDYDAVRGQYERLLENRMKAQMAENLEQNLKAERFSLLETPILPDKPFKPDRMKLMAVGLAASFGLPIGLVLILGFLDKTIRGEKAVEIVTGEMPLVVIGYVETEEERKRAILKKRLMFFTPAMLIVISVSLVYLYPPIYTLLYGVID